MVDTPGACDSLARHTAVLTTVRSERSGTHRPVAPRLVVHLRVGAVLAAVDAVGVQAEERVWQPARLRTGGSSQRHSTRQCA